MIDPTSDVGHVDESDAPTCVVCGERIVMDPHHRVVTWIEDGESQVRDFCSDECRDSWLEDEGPPV